MTQEEKELLLKDLCGRLLYGVKAQLDYGEDIITTVGDVSLGILHDIVFDGIRCKPYLRPMESMTEEEFNEYEELRQDINDKLKDWKCAKLLDFLNKKMFDYRGLIPMGLALKALDGMYKFE